ncbi:MAG: response regulator transcription factor [Dehalococcoidia bacterium]|nr:MAG: response regulator transcription factor [Dehalococcoidia bacterium]
MSEQSKQKIKVCTFSQQPLFQEGILRWLSGIEDIQIIGQAKVTEKEVIIEIMPPDVVIVDIDAPSDSGLGLVQRLKQRLPSVGVIVLTSSPNDDQLLKALETQIAAYLSKEISGDYLANTIRRVAKGEHPIREDLTSRPEVAGKILHQFQELSTKPEVETLIAPLTARETEILSYVAQGYSNKQIAVKLNISEQTIKNHVASIMLKLNANARTQAVVIAVQKGLISIDQPPNPTPRQD